MATTKQVISNDHILITKDCGCKLHVFLTDQYEELCEQHKKEYKNTADRTDTTAQFRNILNV